jgi:hypothetical protein
VFLDIYYRVGAGGVDTLDAGGRRGDPAGVANGRPDRIDLYADAFAEAWHDFESPMGFRPISERVNVVVNPFGLGGLSLPNLPVEPAQFLLTPRTIFIDDQSPAYLPHHELFHQQQYEYVDSNDIAVHFPSMTWWMEATAEWAAHRIAEIENQASTSYAQALPAFLGSPHLPLDRKADVQLGPEYGSFVYAEYLHETAADIPGLSRDAAGDRTIARTWELSGQGPFGRSPSDAIEEVLTDAGRDPADALEEFRIWTYLLDRPVVVPPAAPPPGLGLGFADEDVEAWRDELQGFPATQGSETATARPAREELILDGSVDGTEVAGDARVYDTGAAYADIALTGNRDRTATLVVTSDAVEAQSGKPDDAMRLTVLAYAAYPQLCQEPETLRYEAGHAEQVVPLAPGCTSVTLVMTNTQPSGSPTPHRPTDVGWHVEHLREPDDAVVDTVQAPDGATYVLGTVSRGTLRLGTFDVIAPMYDTRTFVAKRLADGSYEWVSTIAGGRPTGLVSTGDAVFVIGNFNYTVRAGASVASAYAVDRYSDGYLARLDHGGTWSWIRQVGGSNYRDALNSIDADASGNVWVAGHFTNELFYDRVSTGLATTSPTAAVLLGFDGNGALVHQTQLSATGNQASFSDIDVAPDGGAVYLAGRQGMGGAHNSNGGNQPIVVNGYPVPTNGICCSGYAATGMVLEYRPRASSCGRSRRPATGPDMRTAARTPPASPTTRSTTCCTSSAP